MQGEKNKQSDNMNPKNNYIEINREAWNQKTDIHLKSDFYDHESFLNGKTSLNEIELIVKSLILFPSNHLIKRLIF